jgi:hypothetical protein
MQKIGGSTTFPDGKSSADAFEMVVGAFYKEMLDSDLEHQFHDWFDDTFTPLIYAADLAFRSYEKLGSLLLVEFCSSKRSRRWKSDMAIIGGTPAPTRKKKKRKTHEKGGLVTSKNCIQFNF